MNKPNSSKTKNQALSDETLTGIYDVLVNNAFTTLDLVPYWDLETPAILASRPLTCDDGTTVTIYLAVDDTLLHANKCDYYLLVKYRNRYLEYPLHCNHGEPDNWFQMMESERVLADVLEVLHNIINGGKDYMEKHIEMDGILWGRSFALTEKRMDNVEKLSATCAFSVNGQVFHGINELETYCRIQKEDSSPYVLKRCHELPLMNQDDDIYGSRFCRNYLICKSKDEAERFMLSFIGIGNVSALKTEDIPQPEDFPPLICYVDRSRYMVLSYREGEVM